MRRNRGDRRRQIYREREDRNTERLQIYREREDVEREGEEVERGRMVGSVKEYFIFLWIPLY